MKNIFHFVSIFLLSSLLLFAQNKTENFNDWEAFSPSNEEFSIDLPDMDFHCDYDEILDGRRYEGVFEGTYIFVFSDVRQTTYYYDQVMNFVSVNHKAEIEKQKDSAEMKFEFVDEDYFHTIYIAKTQKRAYTFHIISPTENNPAVKHFYDTLKINSPTVAGDLEKKKPIEKIVEESGFGIAKDKNLNYGKSDSSPKSGGFSTGSNSNTSQDKKVENSPLQITFKAKPAYTDFARLYNITGDVRIRATFSKDGTITAAVPVTKLPFGLTKSAITAAQKMRFEPQTINGRAVSVTKVVVYIFTIY